MIFFLAFAAVKGFGQTLAPNLRTAANFALFTANGAFTNSGASQVNGDIGTNVGALTGFPPGTVTGSIRLPGSAEAGQAALDVAAAYNYLNTVSCGTTISADLTGQTLSPGVSCQTTASPTTLNGTLTLSGSGIFIIKLNSALTTGTSSNIVLTNGATANNVFFQVNGAVVAGTSSNLQGTFLVNGAITLNTGAALIGRGLSITGAIVLNGNTVTNVAIPLPVTLVSFAATVAPATHTVDISWTTSLETNNRGFVVERSKDLKTFTKVGEVGEIAATSKALKNYTLVDLTPYAGTSYYRLKQTDLSGKMTIYPAVSVVLRDDTYGVFPNPVRNDGQFSLRLDEPETATVRFYGIDARALPIQKASTQSGNLLLKTAGKLAAGVYVLTVEERGQTRQHRLVVE
ncbi:ice-binding family protein [Spirosoma utsteinense]|uniref:Formylmethanofuran dehydrogenase subunit C n=1 Tax=Spirosoma utsteinense TaxID=2585773 RepID=A0ABR6W8E0_9BACT|nr:ice-binding family protein [Spirosoma utsteinense]MBC3784074.1 formylmethanofuran dehydrogenase subunit C [Spirosoma utsteinense]MBC3792839.1 formylmethanofuran dehydrogenase subunit C [Spirosoma utsteinense]